MIIKNEEQYLSDALHRIKDYVDEIIIVDTGSTDKSKEIASKYTNKIYGFEWCDDFAKARNFSISKATNDWILILDADEMVLDFDKNQVERFMDSDNKKRAVGRIKVINLFEEENEIKKSIVYISRFFNKNYFCYEGSIHEQVISKQNTKYNVEPIKITIEHLGYLNEIMSKKNKSERNISLLMNAIKSNTKDPYYYYQLGKSYYKIQQYKKALENFKQAINLCENFKYEYAQDLVESHGYTLLKCEQYSEAMQLLDYEYYYGQSPDYNFIIGLIYMNNGKFQDAIGQFKKCIGGREGKVEGINSYQPKYNIGVIYEVLGETEKAIKHYKECGDYLPAQGRLSELIGKPIYESKGETMKLSIAMMVKNEERYLDICLSSLKPIMDNIKTELIIVDTGSEDKTVEIAKKYTDKIYFHKWNNDFASMRNQTISYATGEWILILDGDEVFENTEKLVEFLKSSISKQYNTGSITIRNITTDAGELGDVYFGAMRLFRNKKGLRYKGAIHEQPQYREPIYNTDVTVSHYGYFSGDKDLMELKFTRNVKILNKELEKDPNNIYYWYQLSTSYGMHKDYERSLEANVTAYTIAKENNISLRNHMYIYTHLALAYFWNEKYTELETICLEALSNGGKYIDLYFFLGKAQKQLAKSSEAIKNYKKYLKALKEDKNEQTISDISVPSMTIGLYEEAYLDLCILHQEIGNKEEALKYAKKIEQGSILKKVLPFLVKLYIDLQKYDELVKVYSKIPKTDESALNDFRIYLENNMYTLEDDKKGTLIELFSTGDSKYSLLNKVRLSIKNNNEILSRELIKKIKEIEVGNLPLFYADLTYFCLENQYNLGSLLRNSREDVIESHIYYLNNQYKDLDEIILTYLTSGQERISLADYRIDKILAKNYLFRADSTDKDFKNIANRYIADSIYYITQVYSKKILDNELIYDVKDSEDAFLVYIYLANKYMENNMDQYARYLKKALATYPEMTGVIEVLLEEAKKKPSADKNQELEIYKKRIKDEIRTLIEKGEVDVVSKLIERYESMIKEDVEIYSMKAVMLMIQGNIEEARQVLLEGLEIQPNHPDLTYNLDYINGISD